MLWAMSNDDFNNHCGDGAWPLMTTLKQQLPDEKYVPFVLLMSVCLSLCLCLSVCLSVSVSLSLSLSR